MNKSATFGSWAANTFGPNIDADYIKNTATSEVNRKLQENATGFGREVVEGPKGGKSPGIAGQIGKAIASKMPDSPELNTLPKIFIGFQQGGLSGGLQRLGSTISSGLGNLMGKIGQADSNMGLPEGVAGQIGGAFKDSPAAENAANILAPTVNKAFDNLTQNSIFGKGLKMLTDSGAYWADKAKEFGLSVAGKGGKSTGA